MSHSICTSSTELLTYWLQSLLFSCGNVIHLLPLLYLFFLHVYHTHFMHAKYTCLMYKLAHMDVHTYACTYLNSRHVHTHARPCMHTHMRTHTCTRTHSYAYTHMHTHTHAQHSHTYVHCAHTHISNIRSILLCNFSTCPSVKLIIKVQKES